jgi:hypothetical protein
MAVRLFIVLALCARAAIGSVLFAKPQRETVHRKNSGSVGIRAIGNSDQTSSRALAIPPPTSNYVSLQRIFGLNITNSWLHALRNSMSEKDNQTDSYYPITSVLYDESRTYLANISAGSQVFQVIVDTGSSDTWIVHENFSCVDYSLDIIPV